MVWCAEHGERHKGKLRKYGCACAKRQGIENEDFKGWFNKNLYTLRDMLEEESRRKRGDSRRA